MNEKKDTWTVTVELTVFAGDMDKSNVIGNAEKILEDITVGKACRKEFHLFSNGTDFCGYVVTGAKRDE